MHYKNGRMAVSGDYVITKSYTGKIVAGVVFDLNATSPTCNASVAVTVPGGIQVLTCQTLSGMFHVEDAAVMMEKLGVIKAENEPAYPLATPPPGGWPTVAEPGYPMTT